MLRKCPRVAGTRDKAGNEESGPRPNDMYQPVRDSAAEGDVDARAPSGSCRGLAD